MFKKYWHSGFSPGERHNYAFTLKCGGAVGEIEALRYA